MNAISSLYVLGKIDFAPPLRGGGYAVQERCQHDNYELKGN